MEASGRIINLNSPAYCLGWTKKNIVLACSDKRIILYDVSGKLIKIFDYSKAFDEKEFTALCCSPSGQSIAVGSWNKVNGLFLK